MSEGSERLLDLQRAMQEYADAISAPSEILPTLHESQDGGHPHIEWHDGTFHYVAVDRGKEVFRRTTRSEDEVLYWIFSDITHSIASKQSAREDRIHEDPRRVLFVTQLELLRKLSNSWGERREHEIDQKLSMTPFDDASIVRARYSKQLRNRGIEAAEAWRLACQRYPLPIHPVGRE